MQATGNRIAMEALLRTSHEAPILTAPRELQLARASRDGSRPALNELVASHLRLVVAIAREFSGFGLPREDLVGEGLLGLVEAAHRFDPDRGVRLGAYGAWWIRATMRRYTIQNRRIVRAPSSRHGRKLFHNLRRVQRELARRHGVPPDAQAVAAELSVDVRDVDEMELALSVRDVPLGVGDRGAVDLADDSPSPEEVIAGLQERRRSHDAVARALAGLDGRARRILERHFGDRRKSLASVGRGLGLSRERVRQIERRACGRLREAVMSRVA